MTPTLPTREDISDELQHVGRAEIEVVKAGTAAVGISQVASSELGGFSEAGEELETRLGAEPHK